MACIPEYGIDHTRISKIRAFSVPISMGKRNKLRIIQGFGGSDDAFNRTMSTLEKVKLVFHLV